jgi:hypothetical protein
MTNFLLISDIVLGERLFDLRGLCMGQRAARYLDTTLYGFLEVERYPFVDS